MPTAADFASAAARLRGVLARVDAARTAVADQRATPALAGGPIAATLDHGMADATADLATLGGHGADLLAELDRRRLLCEEFAAEMRIWRLRMAQWHAADVAYRAAPDAVAWPGPAPSRPLPPFAGAEA